METPEVVAFDMLETFFSLSALEKRFHDAGLPDGSVGLWLARVLRDGFALETAGRFVRFQSVARAALEVMLEERALPPASARQALEGLTELDAHPEAVPAARRLREAGVRVVALTNGSIKSTEALLRRAGAEKEFEGMISIDDAGHWKPAREAYLFAADACGVEPERICLVSAHEWDIQGANAAGLMTVWAPRAEKLYTPVMEPASLHARDLMEAAGSLLELSEVSPATV